MLNDKQIFEDFSKSIVDISYPISDVVALIKHIAQKQPSTDRAQLTSCIAAVVKCSASAGQDPFVKTKGPTVREPNSLPRLTVMQPPLPSGKEVQSRLAAMDKEHTNMDLIRSEENKHYTFPHGQS